MIEYTRQYIRQLLDRFMDGTSTLQEEDILCRYFTQVHVPAEWEQYRLMFAEIEAMKPSSAESDVVKPSSKPKRRWLRWSMAAAIAGIGWLALWTSSHHPSNQPLMAEKQTEQRDTVGQEIPDKEQQPKKTPVKTQDDVKQPSDTPPVKTHDDDVTVPKKRRSLRKPQPTMTDYDKAYTLMAEAEQERLNIEMEMRQCQQQLIEAQLAAYGYIPVMQEDGSILYINEQTEYIAYEE